MLHDIVLHLERFENKDLSVYLPRFRITYFASIEYALIRTNRYVSQSIQNRYRNPRSDGCSASPTRTQSWHI